MNDYNYFYEVNMRIEYMKRFSDNFVPWSITHTDAESVKAFFFQFADHYGKWGDAVIAYRVDGGEIIYPKDEVKFVKKNEYVQDMIQFFFNNDIEAAKRARKARM